MSSRTLRFGIPFGISALLVVLVRTAPGSSAGTIGVRLLILAGIVAIALYKIL